MSRAGWEGGQALGRRAGQWGRGCLEWLYSVYDHEPVHPAPLPFLGPPLISASETR